MEFSERLKELRTDRDMSQIELAKALNLRSSAISKYENNLTQPSIDTLKKLANIFDVTVDYLVGVSDIENPYEKDKITPYEAEFVAKLRRLNYENRIRIDERMKAMIEVQPM
ncbi:MAG: helix-turn-helix domain-containing protein [Acutalibacteraceae bacterium]